MLYIISRIHSIVPVDLLFGRFLLAQKQRIHGQDPEKSAGDLLCRVCLQEMNCGTVLRWWKKTETVRNCATSSCCRALVWQPEGWLLISLDPREPQHTPGTAYPRHPQRPKWKEFRNINKLLVGGLGVCSRGMLKNSWIGGIYAYYCKPIAKAIGVMAFAILSGDLPFQAPKSWRCWGQS